LRETSAATHSFKHNEADVGAIDVSDAGSMVSGKEYYVTEIGTSDFNDATSATVVNTKDLNNGASGLGLIFTANATTLAGTGRVKEIELLADLNSAATGQKMKVVGGTISDGSEQYNAGDVITIDATKTYSEPAAKKGVANVPLDILNVKVAGDVTTLNIGSTTLKYTASGAGESLATIITGLTASAAAATPAYTAATFAAGSDGKSIDISYAATGHQTEEITIVTSGTVAVTTTGTEKTEGADGGTAKLIKHDDVFSGLTSEGLGGATTLTSLGLDNGNFSNATVWVDEKNPPIKVSYDAVNQRFEFGVNHTAIGPGTDSNFRAFKVYGACRCGWHQQPRYSGIGFITSNNN
jgi:hypothetical protein